MSIWVLINIILVWFCWDWAKRDFENGKNTLGWINIFFSAWNAAAAANALL